LAPTSCAWEKDIDPRTLEVMGAEHLLQPLT